MNKARPAVSRQTARTGLEQTRGGVECDGNHSPDEVERILRERAAALATPLPEVRNPTALLDLLVVTIAGERYGIETAYALEVMPVRDLTPVPCTPPCVLGVVNHRGRILPILDVRRVFDLPGEGAAEGGQVVAVQAMGMTFGIFVEVVAGTVRVAAQEVSPPPAALTGKQQSIIRGVTKEIIAVLDLEALARDPRITVNEEVG